MGTDGAEWGTAQRGNNNASARARAALSEALAELRRLIQDPLFDGVERALASLGNTPIEPEFAVETVRRLQQWSAEHQRVAIELEAAARCCRLVEREIAQQVDALPERPSAKTKRRTGQLREMFRRGRGITASAATPEPSVSRLRRRAPRRTRRFPVRRDDPAFPRAHLNAGSAVLKW